MPKDTGHPSPLSRLTGDLWGGLASMLVALPSAIAFGVLVFTAIGSEHAGAGAMAGAMGTAALGLIAPLVGRNGGFITAPCAPAAAVMSGLAGILAANGTLPMERIVALMALAALLSAGMQIVYGLLRLGRLIKYIPYQVVSGYLSGVAVIIAVGQIPKWLGLPGDTKLIEGLAQPHLWQWPGMVVGLVTIIVTLGAPVITKVIPSAILGLSAGIGTYFAIGGLQPELLVLENNALLIGTIETSGSLLDAILRSLSSLRSITLGDLELVAATAATLSVLLSIDTLKTGVVLDALTHRRHESNRELIAQGSANAVAALVGAMPGAGTMGPTLVNVTSGGRSPWSGFFEGAFALTTFLLLRSVIAWVPIGALAGILLVVASKMFDWRLFRLLLQPATRLDFIVISAVIIVAKGVGLIQASVVGIALAVLIFIRNQLRGSVIRRQRDLSEVASKTARIPNARAILDAHGEQALLVELQDDLFFGTTDQLYSELNEDLGRRRFMLFDLRRVQSMDYTAGNLFNQMHQRLKERDGQLLLSGLPSSLPTRQDIERYLEQLGLVGEEGGIALHDTRNEALEWMEERVLEAGGWKEHPRPTTLDLEDFELLREFDAEALKALHEICEPMQLEAGATLFARGDEGDELYLIRRGAVEVLLPLQEGKRHHVATIARGDYFGEMSFLDREPRSADVEAKRETELFKLSRERFNALAHHHPVVATKVFARLALMVSHRMRAANAEIRLLEER
ncbi:MAG: SLC26A/SulP transporter family protein [Deltaproteobacteria bacterium]|nr:SLC26A/SulP transporter family protein [Deltaproteobacteria bacterium]